MGQQNKQKEHERQARIDAENAERKANEEKAFFNENPDLLNYYKNSEKTIIQTRDKLQKAAEDFYDLDDSQIATYISHSHRPELAQ